MPSPDLILWETVKMFFIINSAEIHFFSSSRVEMLKLLLNLWSAGFSVRIFNSCCSMLAFATFLPFPSSACNRDISTSFGKYYNSPPDFPHISIVKLYMPTNVFN